MSEYSEPDRPQTVFVSRNAEFSKIKPRYEDSSIYDLLGNMPPQYFNSKKL